MDGWIIWNMNPDLTVRSTITDQGPGPMYTGITSGNFISANYWSGIIDLYDPNGVLIKSINFLEEEDSTQFGDMAGLLNGGFVITTSGGDTPHTPFLYFYDNNLNLIHKVDISSEKVRLYHMTAEKIGSLCNPKHY